MNILIINERIKILIEELNLNNRSFALKLGIDPTIIHNIVAGRKSHPSFTVLEKIILTFDNIEARWLLTGKGNKYTTSSQHPSMIEENAPEYGRLNREALLEKEVINLKGQIEAYKNVIASLSINSSFGKDTDKSS
jgi:hypothetical protein